MTVFTVATTALALLLVLLNGALLTWLAAHFVTVRPRRWWKLLLCLTFGASTGMVIWVGDPNMLYTAPFFYALSLLATQGNWMGRLAVTNVFFCVIMSLCALLDTYLGYHGIETAHYELLTRLIRPGVLLVLVLFFRRRLPKGTVTLPPRLWKLVLGLSWMPFFALVAEVLLTYPQYRSATAYAMAMNQGLVLLPFVFLTALILLLVILALADHEDLEQRVYLAGLREVYYQGMRREHQQVRTLRHDLRNHITVVRGLLERGETRQALGYLDQLTDSASLSGGTRLCENETANVVLTAKAEEMERRGLTGSFQVALPKELPVADMDLCALLGNSLDNAMEAAEKGWDKRVTVRCRADKGLLMLRVDNALAGDEKPGLATTKPEKAAHGFGLPSMREIAKRYGGSLETRTADGRFELVVCLPL